MIQSFKNRFEPHLRDYVRTKIRESQALIRDDFLKEQIESLEDLVMAGGKRVRPYLIDLMYRSAGGTQQCPYGPLIGMELFHVFCLIHDDVMDQGTSRHTVPTFHIQTAQALKAQQRPGDIHRVSESQAILIGDLVHSWAHSCFLQVETEDMAQVYEVNELVSQMVSEVILGQMIDVDSTTLDVASKDMIERKMNLKTARYTFVGPMKIGRALATQSKALDQFCEQFGTSLGLAFQIQDDLLDLVTPSTESTKSVLSDLAQRQHTLFTYYIFNHGTAQEIATLRRYFGQPCTDGEEAHIQTLFKNSGAIEYGLTRIRELLAQAQSALNEAPLEETYREQWQELLNYVSERKH
ncbi:MAG TPA: polyprenyl synthetase family protein [Patescibacteria group bacterium]